MSDDSGGFNPYQPAAGQPSQHGEPALVARKVAELARWQTFFAVLMTIGIVGMMGMVAITIVAGAGPGEAMGGIVCLGGATLLFYVLPAVMLWKASAAARHYSQIPDSQRLADFASTQVAFWRTVGIIAAVVLGLYALVFVAAMLVGVTAAVS